MTGDSEMRTDSPDNNADGGVIDVAHYRKLVKMFIDMVSQFKS